MTVGTATPRVEYVEDGVTTAFAVPYQFRGADELSVYRITDTTDHGTATLTLNADYSVTGGNGDVGSITLLTASVSGATLRIDRNTHRSQLLDYEPGDTFPAESHEEGLDRLEMQIQEIVRDELSAEQIRDLIGKLLKAGAGIEIVVDDEHNTITIINTGVLSADGIVAAVLAALPDCLLLAGDEQSNAGQTGGTTGGAGLTADDVYTIVKAILVPGTDISLPSDDTAKTITIDGTTGGGTDDDSGLQPISAMLSDLASVGMAADKMWVGTGPNAVEQLAISAFMQGLMATADAATLATDIGALAVSAASLANPGYIKLSNGLIINWGQTVVGGDTTPTVNYAHAYTSFSIPVGSGGSNNVGKSENCRVIGASTTGFTVINDDGTSYPATFWWIAIGV